MGPLMAFLIGYAILYVVYLNPKATAKRDASLFDSRVLGYIDALYTADVPFHCTDSEMRRYVSQQLEKAHALPDNHLLIEYTTKKGHHYSSHTGLHGEHALFAILCLTQYAQAYGHDDLLCWCESAIPTARLISAHLWI